MYLYGYLYNDTFYPDYPATNLITFDYDTTNFPNFSFFSILNAGYSYILIITTVSQAVTGSFDIVVTGPADATFTTLTLVTTRTTTTTTPGMFFFIAEDLLINGNIDQCYVNSIFISKESIGYLSN